MNSTYERRKTTLSADILFRIFVVFTAGIYGSTALFQPETLIYQVAHADAFSELIMFSLCLLTIIGAVDVGVNDLLPERFVAKRTLKERHLINMAITLCFAVQMWTCVKYGLPRSILPFYGLLVVLIPIAAFIDIQKRYRFTK